MQESGDFKARYPYDVWVPNNTFAIYNLALLSLAPFDDATVKSNS
jgi:hypothetical protein